VRFSPDTPDHDADKVREEFDDNPTKRFRCLHTVASTTFTTSLDAAPRMTTPPVTCLTPIQQCTVCGSHISAPLEQGNIPSIPIEVSIPANNTGPPGAEFHSIHASADALFLTSLVLSDLL
jgi:hypothetical protein